MRDKPSEWVSIADLMSGVMAVVVLLLVVSVIKSKVSDVMAKQVIDDLHEKVAAPVVQVKTAERLLEEDLLAFFQTTTHSELLSLSVSEHKITLKDSVFERGSACITGNAGTVLQELTPVLATFFQRFGSGRVLIEGHTDNIPVSRPVTDFQRFCTVYDDNYTLSAARARETRKHITPSLPEEHWGKLVVAGFGESSPLAGLTAEDAANRRVEIRFVMTPAAGGGAGMPER